MGRADGVHFGTGVEPADGIFDILDDTAPTILNEPEARHWWAHMAQRRSGLTVWRAAPEKKPADVNWSAHAYSREIFTAIDWHYSHSGVYPTDILLLNELNLDYERGEEHNDGGAWDTNPDNWPGLYTKLATFLDGLLIACKERAQARKFEPRWWFQAWAPGHGEMNDDIAAIWVPTAANYDAITLHAYHDHDTITNDTLWYERTFPNHDLLLGEWNMINLGGDWRSMSQQQRDAVLPIRIDEMMLTRGRLRAMCEEIPRLSTCYFIDIWANDDSHEHDIHGVDQRMAGWDGRLVIPEDDWTMDGGGVEPGPEPGPEPEPEPTGDPWEYWTPEQIATAIYCPVAAVTENWPKIYSQLVLCDIADLDVQVSVLATTAIETASTFEPVREAFWMDEEWRQQNLRYWPYYGRGFIQLTWESNYSAYGPRVAALWSTSPDQADFQFVSYPDNVLTPDIAAACEAIYFRDTSTLQGYRLVHAARSHDWEWVRRLVQGGTSGLDRLTQMANDLLTMAGVAIPPPATIVYNAEEPPHPQNESYDCSQDSLEWGMYAVGRSPSDGWMTAEMIRQQVLSAKYGLLDSSGAGLAAFITREWNEFGFTGENADPITFDDVVFEAGHYPVLIGGRNWCHWTGVRSYDAENDVLILANPTSPWQGVYQTMNRSQFTSLGSFSLVRIQHPDLPRPGQKPPEPVEPETDAEKVERMTNAIAYLGDDVADRLEISRASVDDGVPRPDPLMTASQAQAALAQFWANWDREYQVMGAQIAEMRRVREEQVGPRP